MSKIDWSKPVETVNGRDCRHVRVMNNINTVRIYSKDSAVYTAEVFDDGISPFTGRVIVRNVAEPEYIGKHALSNVAEKPVEPEYLTLAEVFTALGEGKKLSFSGDLLPNWIKMFNDRLVDSDGKRHALPVLGRKFTLYTEPKAWYEDIPEGGVLCWVDDSNEKPSSDCLMKIIIGRSGLGYFSQKRCFWPYATRLTPEEIQVFLDNARVGME